MTKEEKLTQLSELLAIPGNTTKLIRYLVLNALKDIEDESQLDALISMLSIE